MILYIQFIPSVYFSTNEYTISVRLKAIHLGACLVINPVIFNDIRAVSLIARKLSLSIKMVVTWLGPAGFLMWRNMATISILRTLIEMCVLFSFAFFLIKRVPQPRLPPWPDKTKCNIKRKK